MAPIQHAPQKTRAKSSSHAWANNFPCQESSSIISPFNEEEEALFPEANANYETRESSPTPTLSCMDISVVTVDSVGSLNSSITSSSPTNRQYVPHTHLDFKDRKEFIFSSLEENAAG